MAYPDTTESKLPKIVWENDYGIWVNLEFQHQMKNPHTERKSNRTINIAASGTTEVIYNREDRYYVFELDWISESHYLEWVDFHDSAKQGRVFRFYEDKSINSYVEYQLLEDDWNPARMEIRCYWAWQERWKEVQ